MQRLYISRYILNLFQTTTDKIGNRRGCPTTNFKMATRDWLSSLALFNKRRVWVRGAHYDHLSFNQHSSSSLLVLMCYLTSDGKSLA